MVVVKTEPNLDTTGKTELDVGLIKDQFLFTPKNDAINNNNNNNISSNNSNYKLSSSKIPNSRPYTNNKNKVITNLNKNDRNDMARNKVNFSNYILSTSNITKNDLDSSNTYANKNLKTYKNETIIVDNTRSSPVVKTEIFDKNIFSMTDLDKKVVNSNHGSSNVNDNDGSIEVNKGHKVKRRSKIENLNITGKLKKTKQSHISMNNSVNIKNTEEIGNDQIIPKDPGKKKIINELLYERKNILNSEEDKEKLFVELFEDVDPNEELDYCKDIVQYPLENWLECGHIFTTKHENLIKELMKTRLDLSYKFQVITKVMNDRCEALMTQEDRLDDKLKQIKTIAKNMLDIL